MRIEPELKLGFKDVLIRPKRSTLKSRSQVNLERSFIMRHTQNKWEGVPVIAANMDSVGTFKMAESLKNFGILTAIHKHYDIGAWKNFIDNNSEDIFDHFMVSCGALKQDFTKLSEIINQYPAIKFICIDVANGYTEGFVEFVRSVRDAYPNKIIVAGNVVTGEMVEELVLSGADIVKVGIGPGSVCTTRVKTGVGYPQLSAIIECADAAHGLKGHIIADGGCTCAGDVAKAFGAGADFVMMGGMLAGHTESEGEIIEKDGQTLMSFYGMSSKTAMKKHSGGVANYKASEGKTVQVPYRGDVENTVNDILGGLRSSCTYVGASKLKELSKRTTFIRVREQENIIFSEASN
jgi:GMP reductase